MKHYSLFINGKKVNSHKKANVIEKATGKPFATISVAGPKEVKAAVDAAQRAFEKVKLAPYARYQILMKAAAIMMGHQKEFATALAKEAGKPIKDAMGEIGRAFQTLILSAEEAKRLKGEVIPIQGAPGCEKRFAYTKRLPLGVVAAITPFNFPVNLACHKIGPAIAAGDTVVYKPATATPVTAAMLCEAFAEAGLPAGCLNLVMGPGGDLGKLLTADPRIKMFSFTGSVPVRPVLRPTTESDAGSDYADRVRRILCVVPQRITRLESYRRFLPDPGCRLFCLRFQQTTCRAIAVRYLQYLQPDLYGQALFLLLCHERGEIHDVVAIQLQLSRARNADPHPHS
jgi:delta 1-pyrroline-5-carboxylate dehydrogenase